MVAFDAQPAGEPLALLDADPHREPRPPRAAVSRLRKRIAFVGGIDRIERQIVSYGVEVGVDVEVHHGRTSGSSSSRIGALAHRSDLLVIVTGTNSHNAVRVAKREASKAGVPVHIVTFCGAAAARALIAQVASR
jgi:hypothetical protein